MTDRSAIVKSARKQAKPPRGRPPTPGAREALVSAGLSAMHGRGYHATGVAEVVQHAATPKGTFYAHFESKDAFGAAVVDRFADGILSALCAQLEDPLQPSALRRLRGFFQSRIEHYREAGCARGCLLGNFGLELSDESPTIRARVRAQLDRYAALLASAIAEAQLAGEVRRDRRADVLARQVLRAWEGALLAMRVEQRLTPLREFVTIMIDDFLAPR